MMKISLIYDNTTAIEGLEADWGFACLIEYEKKRILFDTGAKGEILLGNMSRLEIDPKSIDMIFISHDHWDHTGGLEDFLKLNNTVLYVPNTCEPPAEAKNAIKVGEAMEISEGIHSTGVLKNIEQSLVFTTPKGLVIIAGCSHPGVGEIMKAASQFGKCFALIGGLHGFEEYELLEGLQMVCPTHCTQHIDEIKKRYPKKYIEGGAGKVIEL